MSKKGIPRIDPPERVAPALAGTTLPSAIPQQRRSPTTQAILIQQQSEELAEFRRKSEIELENYRQKCVQADQRILEISTANATLAATNGYQLRELRANGLALVVAGVLAVMGGALISYVESEPAKLAALILTAIGSFWALAQGIMVFVKDDRDSKAAQRTAIILALIIVALLVVHWRDIANCLHFLLSTAGWKPKTTGSATQL